MKAVANQMKTIDFLRSGDVETCVIVALLSIGSELLNSAFEMIF